MGQIERLRKADSRELVDVVFGDATTHAGTARTIERKVLLQSVADLLPGARRLPGGFQVRVPPLYDGTGPIVGPGAGGVLIEGQNYYIHCWEDYWTIELIEELSKGKEPVRHYEPAKIPTQNQGVIVVEVKRSKRSDLVKLLRDLEKFLSSDPGDRVTIIWG
jgi:hypothetical protein